MKEKNFLSLLTSCEYRKNIGKLHNKETIDQIKEKTGLDIIYQFKNNKGIQSLIRMLQNNFYLKGNVTCVFENNGILKYLYEKNKYKNFLGYEVILEKTLNIAVGNFYVKSGGMIDIVHFYAKNDMLYLKEAKLRHFYHLKFEKLSDFVTSLINQNNDGTFKSKFVLNVLDYNIAVGLHDLIEETTYKILNNQTSKEDLRNVFKEMVCCLNQKKINEETLNEILNGETDLSSVDKKEIIGEIKKDFELKEMAIKYKNKIKEISNEEYFNQRVEKFKENLKNEIKNKISFLEKSSLNIEEKLNNGWQSKDFSLSVDCKIKTNKIYQNEKEINDKLIDLIYNNK